MTEKDLREIIDEKYINLTLSEKRVADFVEKNPKDVLYLSISELADACSVSDATISRFCKALKLDGYQEFRMSLAQSLSLNNVLQYSALMGEISENDSLENLSQKVLNSGIDSLMETFQLINYDNVSKAVDMIQEARIIEFFGSGSSGVTAMSAMDKFSRIIPNTHCIMDSHIQSMRASLLTKDDLAIALSYNGSTNDTIHILKTAKESGAKTICITRFKRSPITQYADIVLVCGSKEGPLQGGSLSAGISQLFIIEILYNEYFKRHYKINQFNKEKTTKAVSSKLL